MVIKTSLIVLFSIISINSYANNEKSYGGQTMVGSIKKIIVRLPDKSFGDADPKDWHYTSKPNLDNAIKEHEKFTKILKDNDIEVIYHDIPLKNKADSIFVHDPAIITDHGAIILKMGKALRNGEEEAIKMKFKSLQIPILFELHGKARAEGGDILWVDHTTLAIGKGFRTNQEGVNQIRMALSKYNISVVDFDLPYDQGKESCLHLQSLISLIDHKKAIIYKKFTPVAFIQLLEQKGFTLIDIPENEYPTMGTNVLALKPNVCLTLDGNPKTKVILEKHGCKVYSYKGNEISYKAEGGPTCLTRPILRDSN